MPSCTLRGALALVSVLCLSPWVGQAEPDAAPLDSPVPLSPDDAVERAVSMSPAVVEARAQIAAADGRLAQNRGLAFNPNLSAGYSLGEARTSASLSQPIALTGGAAGQRVAARAQLQAGEARLERAELSAAATARLAYADARVAAERREIALEAVALSGRLTRAVAAKLGVGEASELDLRLAHLSQAQAATWLLDAQASEARALRQLATLIQRSVAPEDLAAGVLSVAPWSSTPAPGGTRSDVRAAQAEAGAARAELRLARAQTLPPVSVGAFFEQEDDVTFVGPTVSLTLPTFNRNQQARGTALGASRAAEAARDSAAARAQAEQQTAETWLRTAEDTLTSMEADLVGEGHAALESIALGYDAGELDLSTALILQQQVLQGLSATLTLKGQVVAARVDWALAHESDTLLGGTQP